MVSSRGMVCILCACDNPDKSHLPSGRALICLGGGGHILCSRCAPYGRCTIHPTLKLNEIRLDLSRGQCEIISRPAIPELFPFREMFLSKSAMHLLLHAGQTARSSTARQVSDVTGCKSQKRLRFPNVLLLHLPKIYHAKERTNLNLPLSVQYGPATITWNYGQK